MYVLFICEAFKVEWPGYVPYQGAVGTHLISIYSEFTFYYLVQLQRRAEMWWKNNGKYGIM